MDYRIDIQALRGLAVLLVVIYHAGLTSFSGGYLGVDIFFVISGFLITSQIAKSMDDASFSFKAFYTRRAWRLLPAVYSVLFISIIATPFLLSNEELHDFTYQLIGTVTFSANIALWLQTGYFETAAELKPLLHMWSLSIEEQYYLILPLLLFLTTKKYWSGLAVILSIVSLLLMTVMSQSAPGAIFYLTPARVWELGIGSILALHLIKKPKSTPQYLGYIALVLILLLSIKPIENTQFTLINNLVVTIATALLISSRLTILNSNLASITLGKIGAISYSLYLVHWPIIAFLNSASIKVSGPNLGLRLLAILLSFILAITLYIFVEKKWRITTNNEFNKRPSVFYLYLIPLVLISMSLSIELYRNSVTSLPERTKNFGLHKSCKNEASLFSPLCKTSTSPSLFLWGDSYAMHLAPALQASKKANFQQAARSTCSPLLKSAHFDAKKHNILAGIDCLQFNESVFNYISKSNTIQTVVLASPWHYLLHNKPFLIKNNNDFELGYKKKNTITRELIDLVSTLKSQGKKVIVVTPPPSSGFNSRKCHERNTLKLLKIGGSSDCALRLNSVLSHQAKIHDLIEELHKNNISTYSFMNKLCTKDKCITILNGSILYNDGGHLSVRGSEAYGAKYHLYEELELLAN